MLHDGPPVEPRPAASVLLVRGHTPWEVLLVRRPREIEFAPGAHVFPGGSLHAEDSPFADAPRAAALRELFEEAGILIARSRRGPARDADTRRLRELLAAGSGWAAALREAGLSLAFDRLVPLTRWITPEPVRRRFDTHFYLARLPAGQAILPQPGEVVDWLWTPPARALADPGVRLVYATRRILESVAPEPDLSRLLARLRRRRRVPIVRPRIVREPSGPRIVENG